MAAERVGRRHRRALRQQRGELLPNRLVQGYRHDRHEDLPSATETKHVHLRCPRACPHGFTVHLLPVTLSANRQTGETIINKWLQTTAKPLLGPKSLHSYAQFVRLHIVPRIDQHELGKLTPQHVQVMMGEMSAAGLSPRIVQYTRAVLRRALGYALKWGLVSRNVATLVDPPRSQRRPAKWLTGEQARFLLDHARTADNRLWPLLATAVLTGLRQGELLGLRWENVDLDMGTLHVTPFPSTNRRRLALGRTQDETKRSGIRASAPGSLHAPRTTRSPTVRAPRGRRTVDRARPRIQDAEGHAAGTVEPQRPASPPS